MTLATLRNAARGVASAAALAGLVLLAPAAPAFAHNSVIDEGPSAESTISDQPGEVWIETNDVLLDIEGATAMDVVGPDGRHYATACPSVDGAIASVTAELGPAGEYTVAYRVVSADGHPVTGDHAFTWEPADGAALAEGTAEAACATGGAEGQDAAGPGDAVGGVDDDADAAASGAGADVVWIVIAAVVVLGAGIAAFALTRRRPPGEAAPGADEGAAPDADAASGPGRPDDR